MKWIYNGDLTEGQLPTVRHRLSRCGPLAAYLGQFPGAGTAACHSTRIPAPLREDCHFGLRDSEYRYGAIIQDREWRSD